MKYFTREELLFNNFKKAFKSNKHFHELIDAPEMKKNNHPTAKYCCVTPGQRVEVKDLHK